MQPFLDPETRDFKLTPSGDLVMTEFDKAQNIIGNVRVEKGDDIFDLQFGIDWSYISSIGNDDLAKSYILSEINKKVTEEGILNAKIELEKVSLGQYDVKVFYFEDNNEKQLQLTLNQF